MYTGDVTDPAALAKAIKGCEQLVHLAAVVDLLTPKTEPEKQKKLDTALQGTRTVLGKLPPQCSRVERELSEACTESQTDICSVRHRMV